MSYNWQVISSKLSPKTPRILVLWLLGFSSRILGIEHNSQATSGLLNTCAAGCDEFASNQLWVSRSSTIDFSIYVALKTYLAQPKTPLCIPSSLCCVGNKRPERRLPLFFSRVVFLSFSHPCLVSVPFTVHPYMFETKFFRKSFMLQYWRDFTYHLHRLIVP